MAAQLLDGQGFKEAYNLKGGIQGWHGLQAAGPAEVGMAFISGEEAPEEIITIAYGMEEGLRSFYTDMLSKVKDKAVSDLFAQLADIENRHKRRLFELYESMEGGMTDVQAFENLIVSEVMEAGLSPEEFIDLNRPVLETVPGVLDMAMTIETQALDLYLRYSNKAENEETRKVLHQIADEEKAHLRHLGNLMQKKV